MRHSDIRTTVNIYGEVVTDETHQASSKVARLALKCYLPMIPRFATKLKVWVGAIGFEPRPPASKAGQNLPFNNGNLLTIRARLVEQPSEKPVEIGTLNGTPSTDGMKKFRRQRVRYEKRADIQENIAIAQTSG